jgi:hypothetical protein
MRVGIVAAFVLASAGTAAAGTIHVPQDQGTIQLAVNNASDDDVIVVSPGLYKENVTSALNNVKFIGKSAVLDGNMAGTDGVCLTISGTGNLVQGFTFRNGTTQLQIDGTGARVLKCTFIDAQTDAILVNGVAGTQVVGCRFYGANGTTLSANAGSDSTLVQKCQFRQCGGQAIGITGNNVVVEACSFLNVDDSDAVSITGNFAVATGNKGTGISSSLVVVTGDDAVVEKNKGIQIGSDLASVDGARAGIRSNSGLFVGSGISVSNGVDSEVSSNRLTYSSSGISVAGNNVSVSSNSISYDYSGISVAGDNVVVASNKLYWIDGSDAIAVTGDAVSIKGNSIRLVIDDGDGIQLNLNATGGGTIEGNRLDDIAANGVSVSSDTVTIRGNKVSRCGTENESAFTIVGNNNTVDTNSAADSDNVGFRVNGDGNDFVKCVSKNAFADGFRVIAGSDGCTFAACSATGSGGEGFDNRGTNTDLQSGTFQKNRTDIANDTIGGSITIDPSVKFTTGGATTPQEVD